MIKKTFTSFIHKDNYTKPINNKQIIPEENITFNFFFFFYFQNGSMTKDSYFFETDVDRHSDTTWM